MKNNEHRVTLSFSKTGLGLIVFLMGSILVSAGGFGLWTYQKLPQVLKDIEKWETDLKDAKQASKDARLSLQIDIDAVDLELHALNSELPRSHVKNSTFDEHKADLDRRLTEHERRIEKLE